MSEAVVLENEGTATARGITASTTRRERKEVAADEEAEVGIFNGGTRVGVDVVNGHLASGVRPWSQAHRRLTSAPSLPC
jgi:hypothetical protein